MNEEESGGILPKILIVDDSRMVRASLSKQIRHRFQIREESDGEAGWEALLIDPAIRIVLTDLGMPKLDGFGLLERIRGSKVQRIQDLPVVIISGDEDDEARQQALNFGANDFVSKGAGCAEMTARLESLLDLTEIRRSLAMNGENPIVDPDSGLATPAYLNHNGEQLLAQVRRRQTVVTVMVVDIDHYEQLLEWHGDYVSNLITGKLAKILASKVRQEDTISQISGGRFVVLSPSTSVVGCCAFALRLQKAMEKLVLTYREERIRITVTVGISGSEADGVQSVESLIGTATERVRRGIAAGGNRIVSSEGEVDKVEVESYVNQMLSVDHVLLQLRIGAEEEVMERLPEVIAAIMPLFTLLEERLHFGIPLGELENYGRN
ncbi:MAG: response regulator [Azoarcus sp.]|jgi:diguanylate cyclase (GGDEF)-like protein|nr:response regulator [Azoarcus sp.]